MVEEIYNYKRPTTKKLNLRFWFSEYRLVIKG
jgi:hypothetical protein